MGVNGREDKAQDVVGLAKIFILRKMQVSSVYHNYSGLLNIGALLQLSIIGGLKLRLKMSKGYL